MGVWPSTSDTAVTLSIMRHKFVLGIIISTEMCTLEDNNNYFVSRLPPLHNLCLSDAYKRMRA